MPISASGATMSLIGRIFGRVPAPDMHALYGAVVAAARQPGWYREGDVPDTIDGRFDVLSLVLCLTLLRLERDGDVSRLPSARLAECFVEDMDGQLRQSGFGDLVVGKQVGQVMGALGGRLGVYRGGIDDAALVRNLWRGSVPAPAALAAVKARISGLDAALDAVPFDRLLTGQMA
jgi:cytochrome b pre-mRNA-processing protein 3